MKKREKRKKWLAGAISGLLLLGMWPMGTVVAAQSEATETAIETEAAETVIETEAAETVIETEVTEPTIETEVAKETKETEAAKETKETEAAEVSEETEAAEATKETKAQEDIALMGEPTLLADGIEVIYKHVPAGMYRVAIKGLRSTEGKAIEKVNVPVWTVADGMDDVRYYTAVYRDGQWTADIYLSNHHYDAGTYRVQAYAYDAEGGHARVADDTFVAGAPEENYMIVNKSTDQKQIIITVKNAVFPEDLRYPAIAVWGRANGQNDLKWYKLTEIAEKTYRIIFPISNHKETGTYTGQLYAYGTTKNTFLHAVAWNVDGFSCAPAVYARDDKNGYVDICAGTWNAPTPMTEVNMVVWSDDQGTDDLKIYTASKKDGQWVARVDVANHGAKAGSYHAKVYATDARGIHMAAGEMTFNVVKPTVKPSIKLTLDEKTAKVQVTLSNVMEGTNLSVAAWGEDKGQNDLKTYTLTKKDARTYTGTIDLMNHKEKGKYLVYIYATVDGKRKAIASGMVTCNLDLTMGVEGLAPLKQQILNIAAGHSGQWSVYVKDLKTNEYLLINDQPMIPACTIKLFALEGAFRCIQDGKLDYASCYDTLYQMITVSNNECFNEILRRIGGGSHQAGTAWANAYFASQGYKDAYISGTLQPSYTPQAYYGGRLQTSAKDCGHMLERVYRGTAVSAWASGQMLSILKNQQFTEKIPAALPAGVVTANKTGDNEWAHNDACLVYGPKTDYVICVFSNYYSSDWDSLMGTREISAAVYNYLNR